MTQENANQFFLALMREHEFIGMIGLGKIAEPQSGETKVDLEKTKYAIGVLEMLEQKMADNLNETELKELMRVLTFLRINFVEEAKNLDNCGADNCDADNCQSSPQA